MSKLMTNLQIIQREKFCQGSRRRSKREICCFGAYLLGTVLSPLLRQKMRRRKALAAMAMMDDVTKPAPINQWVSASIYRLIEISPLSRTLSRTPLAPRAASIRERIRC
jgi:hypothetical protein